MTTLWGNFAASQVQEAPLSNAALTLTMSGRLQDLPNVGGGDIVKLTLDPEGADTLSGSGTEIVYVTAYTSGAGTATISRGQEGTTPRPHSQGVKIVNAITEQDLIDFRDAVTLGGHLPAYFAAAAALSAEAGTRANDDGVEALARIAGDNAEATTRATEDHKRLKVVATSGVLAGLSPPLDGSVELKAQAGVSSITTDAAGVFSFAFPVAFGSGLVACLIQSADVSAFAPTGFPTRLIFTALDSTTLSNYVGVAKVDDNTPYNASPATVTWIAVGY